MSSAPEPKEACTDAQGGNEPYEVDIDMASLICLGAAKEYTHWDAFHRTSPNFFDHPYGPLPSDAPLHVLSTYGGLGGLISRWQHTARCLGRKDFQAVAEDAAEYVWKHIWANTAPQLPDGYTYLKAVVQFCVEVRRVALWLRNEGDNDVPANPHFTPSWTSKVAFVMALMQGDRMAHMTVMCATNGRDSLWMPLCNMATAWTYGNVQPDDYAINLMQACLNRNGLRHRDALKKQKQFVLHAMKMGMRVNPIEVSPTIDRDLMVHDKEVAMAIAAEGAGAAILRAHDCEWHKDLDVVRACFRRSVMGTMEALGEGRKLGWMSNDFLRKVAQANFEEAKRVAGLPGIKYGAHGVRTKPALRLMTESEECYKTRLELEAAHKACQAADNEAYRLKKIRRALQKKVEALGGDAPSYF